MGIKRITLFLSFIIFLVGCHHNNESSHSENPNIKHLSTNSYHETATQAKELLMEKEDIKAVHAVNTDDTLLITIEVPHHERFSLEDKRKAYQKEIEQTFPNFTIELSTDKKIILETTKLEEKMTNQTISEEELKKKVEEIIHLSKEQT
ncbi:hypothetical protein [Oceanobacillus jeddahense]|uniref:Sporulation protein n=1 Tax=Oceanobacillus jeddahense TaxID=1462527 RepID=A0ABY5JPE5_9BACI|nr:hypothetical protein [Oceanobacillus jeddahense]UUI01699.1 hypothetical protein NP439_16810 [Oceanobacillus jeddahense]